MTSALRMLLVEDSDDDAVLIARVFRRAGYVAVYERVNTPDALIAALGRRPPWDVLLCDTVLTRLQVPAVLALVEHDMASRPLVVVVSGRGANEPPEAIACAADSVVTKDHFADLPAIVTGLMRSAHRRH